jgi:tetratricopeptide (TPR) repeat protein
MIAVSRPRLYQELRTFEAANGHDVRHALSLAQQLLKRSAPTASELNTAICTHVFAGAYREALLAERGLDAARVAELAAEDPPQWTLCQINLAEADYNLGDWDGAWARLERLGDLAGAEPYVRAGYHLQRAWILAHRGEGEAALREVAAADIDSLPAGYHAEHHFTRAAALLALGRVPEAEAAIHEGMDRAQRQSSERNGFFLLARAALQGGRSDEALHCFRRASEHDYLGQGGDGLLAHAEALLAAGHPREARAALRLVVRRDPQSPARALAEARLAADAEAQR